MGILSLDQQIVAQRCTHCGREFVVSRGSAYEDGEGVALYLAGLHACDGPPLVHLAVAVRPGYRGNSRPEAVMLQMWTTEDSVAMRVTDVAASPWSGEVYLGHLLDRDEALGSPFLETAFQIAGRLAEDNTAVATYLGNGPERA